MISIIYYIVAGQNFCQLGCSWLHISGSKDFSKLSAPLFHSGIDCTVAVLNVICVAENKSRSWATYKNIAEASLTEFKVVKIGRNINTVAHDLASLAKRTGLSNVWSQAHPGRRHLQS
jgi:hypothetical protein